MQVKSSKELLKPGSVIAQSEDNDCFVYAFATAFDLDYDTSHGICRREFGRRDKKGVSSIKIDKVLEDMMLGRREGINERKVANIITPTNTYKVKGELITRKAKVSSFTKKYPKGTYLIITRGHAVTVKDGVLLDNNSEDAKSKPIIKAYRVEKEGN